MLSSKIQVRPSKKENLDFFFEFQLDADANQMTAFTSKDSTDKNAYMQKYPGLLSDASINMQTIICNGQIVGSISKYIMEGDAEITHWIDKKFWGQGIATEALTQMLRIAETRPLFGRAAFDNLGSQRVLLNCGFEKIGSEMTLANGRNAEIKEIVYKLSD